MTHCIIHLQVVMVDLFEYFTSDTLYHSLAGGDGRPIEYFTSDTLYHSLAGGDGRPV